MKKETRLELFKNGIIVLENYKGLYICVSSSLYEVYHVCNSNGKMLKDLLISKQACKNWITRHQNKKERLIKKLDEKLQEKMGQQPTKTIASLRKQVVIEAKKGGIIKDYHFVKNRNIDGIYFGSCVGFDYMYRIEL